MYPDEVEIAQIMEVWDIETYNGTPALVEYTNYLIKLRDRSIWRPLDNLCHNDVVTAVKLAEMQ